MRLIHFLIIVLLFISCRKEKPRGDDTEIIGKYEWSWSSMSSVDQGSGTVYTNYLYAGNSTDKYGLEVTKKGKIYYFKNGKLEDDFRIISIYENAGRKNIQCSKHKYFYFQNNEITSYDFPVTSPEEGINYVNYYIKK